MSSKILVTLGITTTKRMPTMTTPTSTMIAGYSMAPSSLLRSAAWASVKSARRVSTTSSAPEDSPARIMFT